MDQLTKQLSDSIPVELDLKGDNRYEVAKDLGDIAASHLDAMLTVFEQKFESNEGEFDNEQMSSYCNSARFMERWKNRESIRSRVWARMKALPF